MIRRVALALILGGLVSSGTHAQVPSTQMPATTPPTPTAPTQTPAPEAAPAPPLQRAPAEVPPPPPTPAPLPPAQAQAPAAAPLPARVANQAGRPARAGNERDPLLAQGRFANPGGVGRFAEYYTPNTPMNGYPGQPVRVAGFGQGGGVGRQDQLEAFRVGQYRTQNIQNNLNAYGRPVGFGFGVGLGYGRGLGGFR